MTAANIITQPDAIHMFCDGAHYLGDGTLGAVSSKAHLLPHLHAAAVCRGPSVFMDMLAPEIGRRFETFAELVDGIVDLARDVFEREADTLALCQVGADFDLFIAGWLGDQPAAYVLASHSTSVEPWILHQLGPISIAPFDDALSAALEAAEPATDVLDAGLAVMELQRSLRGQNAGHGAAMVGVGGHCQYVRITPESIQTAIVRRWDEDWIGLRLGVAA
ncbi:MULTISPECIES: hypothetical protein [Hyphomicrobiales]|jgi:hypothetical protein|uniref:hypothetical protein n=1 Tax=Methylobacterium sp. CCH7-A2 TaxID=1768789 RepID=UPI00082A2531|nr:MULTISPECIES: hypothetical protein [Hyphomicrobiales]